MRLNKNIFLFFLLFSFLFSACNSNGNADKKSVTINLKDRFYWAACNKDSTLADTEKLRFHKFNTDGIANIKKVAGKDQEYVWLMAVFALPEDLRYKPLGLLITHLHFADKVWVNGSYVGGYGDFPPKAKSVLWGSHFYTIPAPLVNPVGRNVILIKVYCKGRSGISNNILLGEHDVIKENNNLHTFLQSIIYLFAEGGMFFTAILFLLIYIWRKKEREYLSFSFLCLSSMVIATPFFAPILPLTYPLNIPFLVFMKLTLCEGLYLITFCLATLSIEFVKKRESKRFRMIRLSIFAISTFITLIVPTYEWLMKICPAMLILSTMQIFIGFFFIVKEKLTSEEKQNLFVQIRVFIPLVISIAIDFFIKGYLQIIDTPYITLFGWLITLIGFLILLSRRYNVAVARSEYLNVKLRREVLKQTRELSEKNSNLEDQIHRAETDLEMASLVQKKFFPYPPRSLRGWDIAVSYSPLDKVSGDMYDFYIKNNSLNGFSLFDVSGHGIAASLVTMLAKNIVFQSFSRNLQNHETVSRTLYEINEEIIEAKGEIENYLTGLMFRFSNFDENDECKVEMANAGHPNPILYSAKTNLCDEIESGDSEAHHGAIGLDFITVSFPQINFTMAEDDILFFYTDGLTEGRNKKNEMFGKERVKKIIKESYAKDAQSIMEDIIDAFNGFTAGVKRDDDITVVVMKRENSANFIEELDEV